jgi:hypothetical protein
LFFLKGTVYTRKELQQAILAALISISEIILAAVIQNFKRSLQMVLDTDYTHNENTVLTVELHRLPNF